MSRVETKTITKVRDNIYSETEKSGITAITRGGKFVGVMISAGELTGSMASQLHKTVRHNPEHGVEVLTKQAIN
jgi:hypothetical protein